MPKGRIEKEKRLIEVMIKLYCRKNHRADSMCEDCEDLLDYSLKRLKFCKFQDEKTSCKKCPIHCYKKDMRAKVKDVMRFSGPRLLLYHLIEVIKHMFY